MDRHCSISSQQGLSMQWLLHMKQGACRFQINSLSHLVQFDHNHSGCQRCSGSASISGFRSGIWMGCCSDEIHG
ncbi:hypothetical protein L1049_014068 [Liquidambar formosana]|uniref:Uncharacterized protein n=1 Tax=Liquidambar formosana TaxID=63359 RepID=A0AAP0RLM4_LIQFO